MYVLNVDGHLNVPLLLRLRKSLKGTLVESLYAFGYFLHSKQSDPKTNFHVIPVQIEHNVQIDLDLRISLPI